ncbi:hypothetical protein BH11ARM2_BH11ARM2_09150 [soil metagenome]
MANAPAITPGGGEPSKKAGSLPIPKSRRGLKGFLVDVQREMRKVTWPSRPETNRLTYVVLMVCGMLVIILSTMGYVFGIIIDLITKGHL